MNYLNMFFNLSYAFSGLITFNILWDVFNIHIKLYTELCKEVNAYDFLWNVIPWSGILVGLSMFLVELNFRFMCGIYVACRKVCI